MLPVNTDFSDKLRFWDPSPGPDKVQVLGVSSSRVGSMEENSTDADGKQGTKVQFPSLARIPRSLPMSKMHLLHLLDPDLGFFPRVHPLW